MRRFLGLAVLLGAGLVSGCATVASPVQGAWFTGVEWGTQVPAGSPGSRSGEASCQTILGLIATGDASVEAAARNGGISKVMTVDHKSFSVMGVYGKFTTKVTGE